MHRPFHIYQRRQLRQQQRGIALFVVIVFVMLSMLLALWASRTSLFNEMVVGNDADYQRAFEATQTLLQDAEQDIKLRNEPLGSALCTAGGDLCRIATTDKFPLEKETVGSNLGILSAELTGCRSGLCTKRDGKVDFWNNKNPSDGPTFVQMQAVAARYGQYTGAKSGDKNNPGNLILQETADDEGGWYWIEIMPYDDSSKTSNLVIGDDSNIVKLNIDANVVYRITAMARGRKPGTLVAMQQTFAPNRLLD